MHSKNKKHCLYTTITFQTNSGYFNEVNLIPNLYHSFIKISYLCSGLQLIKFTNSLFKKFIKKYIFKFKFSKAVRNIYYSTF